MLALVIAGWLSSGVATAQSATTDPEVLYRDREQMPRAMAAARLWQARAAAGTDFESSWKLARARYWIGTHGAVADRRPALDRGIAAATQAVGLEPTRPEGHFW